MYAVRGLLLTSCSQREYRPCTWPFVLALGFYIDYLVLLHYSARSTSPIFAPSYCFRPLQSWLDASGLPHRAYHRALRIAGSSTAACCARDKPRVSCQGAHSCSKIPEPLGL